MKRIIGIFFAVIMIFSQVPMTVFANDDLIDSDIVTVEKDLSAEEDKSTEKAEEDKSTEKAEEDKSAEKAEEDKSAEKAEEDKSAEKAEEDKSTEKAEEDKSAEKAEEDIIKCLPKIANDIIQPPATNEDKYELNVTGGAIDEDYTYSDNGVITVLTNTPITISGTGIKTNNRIVVDKNINANITIDNIDIDCFGHSAFIINLGSTVNLVLKNTNSLNSRFKGINNVNSTLSVPQTSTVFIKGDGQLKVKCEGTRPASAIGVCSFNDGKHLEHNAGTIIIGENVKVIATVPKTGDIVSRAATIGTSYDSTTVEKIIIKDNAQVKATNFHAGAGIGGASSSYCKYIHITDNAKVTSVGGIAAAGIGSGSYIYEPKEQVNIIIDKNATVTSIGGKSYDGNNRNVEWRKGDVGEAIGIGAKCKLPTKVTIGKEATVTAYSYPTINAISLSEDNEINNNLFQCTFIKEIDKEKDTLINLVGINDKNNYDFKLPAGYGCFAQTVDNDTYKVLASGASYGYKEDENLLNDFVCDSNTLQNYSSLDVPSIYLSGVGNDVSGDGTYDNPVETFKRAKELVKGTAKICIKDTVNVDGDQKWGDIKNNNIEVIRDNEFKGSMVNVQNGAKLTLQNITLNGRYDNEIGKEVKSNGSIINVQADGTVIMDRDSVIKNNYSSEDGSGIYNNGILIMKENSAIRGNISYKNGGGVFNKGTFTIKNDEHNENVWVFIQKNSSINKGGGIFNRGVLNLQRAKSQIRENKSIMGCGVYNSGILNMESGRILSNGDRFTNYMGASVCNMGTFNLSGNVCLADEVALITEGANHHPITVSKDLTLSFMRAGVNVVTCKLEKNRCDKHTETGMKILKSAESTGLSKDIISKFTITNKDSNTKLTIKDDGTLLKTLNKDDNSSSSSSGGNSGEKTDDGQNQSGGGCNHQGGINAPFNLKNSSITNNDKDVSTSQELKFVFTKAVSGNAHPWSGLPKGTEMSKYNSKFFSMKDEKGKKVPISVTGSSDWTERTNLIVEVDGGLKEGQKYILTIRKGITAKNGKNKTKEDYVFTFYTNGYVFNSSTTKNDNNSSTRGSSHSTSVRNNNITTNSVVKTLEKTTQDVPGGGKGPSAPLCIETSTLVNNQTNVEEMPTFKFVFSKNVAAENVQLYNAECFEMVDGDGNVVEIAVSGDAYDWNKRRELFVKPLNKLKSATKYKLTISKKLIARNQINLLDKEYVYTFYTEGYNLPIINNDINKAKEEKEIEIIEDKKLDDTIKEKIIIDKKDDSIAETEETSSQNISQKSVSTTTIVVSTIGAIIILGGLSTGYYFKHKIK